MELRAATEADTLGCTLDSPRVAQLLERIFEDVEANRVQARQVLATMTPEQQARLQSGAEQDYRHLYGLARELYLAVSRDTARLLYMQARAMGARTIVEFGTSFGVSTLHLAAALRDNGGGRLIGTELEPAKIARARANLAAAGLEDLVEIREGDALETLARGLPESIDLVLLDGHKPLYAPILDLLGPRLRQGGCVLADNTDAAPDYLARVRAVGGGFVSGPLGADVELSLKL
ncbi:MAG: class I SAM-dependent methyltransferase [Myxococcales bacterium]|nr:class I SAM-dependent methyltransferase [Myxococcales bacterium]MCB9645661.1 class I SAM-dependent methyltransferase [Deltaproteobacteria bacterium]